MVRPDMLDPSDDEYQPRSGDGSIAAEDDSLLRQPEGAGGEDPDVELGDVRGATADNGRGDHRCADNAAAGASTASSVLAH